jgi:chorismate dehydratase
MRKLCISAISFLNTAPLMWDFERGMPPTNGRRGVDNAMPPELERAFEVQYTIPSLCAEALRAGTADIGIIPVAAYADIPGLVIVPDVAIAAKGPVRSILLVSKLPLDQVRTLAADTSSRTSVALAKVLFHHWFGQTPEFVPSAPELEAMLTRCDAALLIGDPALQVDRSRYNTWDLAEEWQRLMGQPFVFAFWAVRLAALPEAAPDVDIAAVFQQSRDRGMQPENIDTIARAWAPRVQLLPAAICEYLTRNVHYRLDDACLAGMDLFFRYAAQCGAIPQAPELRFMGSLQTALTAI